MNKFTKFCAKAIYETIVTIDGICGWVNGFSYCDPVNYLRHIEGHEGKLTKSLRIDSIGMIDGKLSNRTVGGYSCLITKNPFFKIGKHTLSGYYWNKPRLRFTVTAYWRMSEYEYALKPQYSPKEFIKYTVSNFFHKRSKYYFCYRITAKII